MTTIVTRAGKGSPLTHTEVDTNFTNLNTNKLETGAIALGSAATPSISFTGDTNTGIYSPGADQLAVATNGTEKLIVLSNGNVGIGTSSPSADGPLTLTNSTTTNPTIFFERESTNYNGAIQCAAFGTITFYNGADSSVVSGLTPRMTIDGQYGRVGIGTNASNANGGILQLSGGITFPATAVAATDVNTLDDYEEGTWTPSVGGTATYSSQNGTYTKIGRTVTINFSLNITLLGTGSNFQISGLPFNVGSAGYGATGYFGGLAVNVIGLTCNVTGTTVLFNSMNASGSTATNNPAILGNSCLIQGSVTYFV